MADSNWDNSLQVAKYLDRHFVLQILEFVQQNKIYREKDILQAKIEVLSKTNMVDFHIETLQKLHDNQDTPEALVTRRNEVVEELKRLNDALNAIPALQFLTDADDQKVEQTPVLTSKDVAEKQITVEQVKLVLEFARFQYNCGNYSRAATALGHFISITSSDENKLRNKEYLSALWGKFAASKLSCKPTNVLEADFDILKQTVETFQGYTSSTEQMNQRLWLFHWSLFMFSKESRNEAIDRFLSDKSLRYLVKSQCPYLLRYVVTALILNKRLKENVAKYIKLLQQESFSYSDPVVDFLFNLLQKVDFDTAVRNYTDAEAVLSNDFFLYDFADSFKESARVLIFETYSKLHSVVSLEKLSHLLNLDIDATELWVVSIIRNPRDIEARIDSARGCVVFNSNHQYNIHRQVIEKTKEIPKRYISNYNRN